MQGGWWARPGDVWTQDADRGHSLGCVYNQLNVASLASFETLARRAIVDAYSAGAKGSPDWASAQYITNYKGPEDAVSPQLLSWASKRGKEQVDLANARSKIKDDGRRGVWVYSEEAAAVADGGLPSSKAAPKLKKRPGRGLPAPATEWARADQRYRGAGKLRAARSVRDLFPLPFPPKVCQEKSFSRRCQQRLDRRQRLQLDVQDAVRGANWLNGFSPFSEFEGPPDAMQEEVLGRIHYLCKLSSDVGTCDQPLGAEVCGAGVALNDILMCLQTCLQTCGKSFCVAGAILFIVFGRWVAFFGKRSTLETSNVILRGRRSIWFRSVVCGFLRGKRNISESPHSILYTLHSTLYIPHLTLYSPHYTLHTLCTSHSTLYTLLSTICTPHSTLDTFTVHTLHFTVHTLHCTLHTLHFTLHPLHCTLFDSTALRTLHFTLHSLYFTFHNLHSALYTFHFALCTSDSTLHTFHFTLYTLDFTV